MEARYNAVLSWLNRIGVKVETAAAAPIGIDAPFRYQLTFSHPKVRSTLLVSELKMHDWRRERAIYEALLWVADAGNEMDYPDYDSWAETYGEPATRDWWDMIVSAREFFNAIPGTSASDLLSIDDLESGDRQNIQEALLFLQGMDAGL